MAAYTYQVERDDNGTFLITFPSFPEAVTFAETLEEAETRAQDAIATAIQGRISDREQIPAPDPVGRNKFVTINAVGEAKLGLWSVMRKLKVSKAQLARRLECHPPQVDRLLDIRHASRMDQIEGAVKALGGTVRVEVKPPSARKAKGVTHVRT